MENMRIAYKQPNKEIIFMEIDNDYNALRELVGGYLESLYVDDYVVFFDEEGKLKGLDFNTYINGFEIVGNVIISRLDKESGDCLSLEDRDIEKIKNILK